jgi:hypothetical protein
LTYVAYKAMAARNLTQLRDNVLGSWLELQQSLQTAKTPAERLNALRSYSARVNDHVAAASTFHEEHVLPFGTEVEELLKKGASALKGVVIADSRGLQAPWSDDLIKYRRALDGALATGDATNIDPKEFIPEDDFIAPLPGAAP